MIYPVGWAPFYSRWRHKLHARRLGFSRPKTAWIFQPDPNAIGSLERGRQIASGRFDLAGHSLAIHEKCLWDLPMPDPSFELELHGFGWLDDLAAYPNRHTRQIAQDWVFQWIAQYGRGAGPGWLPDLTGRRVIRLLQYGTFLRPGLTAERENLLLRVLARQALFLQSRWAATSAGLPRFEAITGLLYAALSLERFETKIVEATQFLARECRAQIDQDGAIATRSPEDLLEIFTLLAWSADTLSKAGWTPSETHRATMEKVGHCLRGLRHADGGLARFHGGGRGTFGRLENALALTKRGQFRGSGMYMGFARLSSGRTSVIIDASPPPKGKFSYHAHASCAAFEMTIGRRPFIVNCGSGLRFGQDWRRASRATPSHSTLHPDGYSNAQLGRAQRYRGVLQERITHAPNAFRSRIEETSSAHLWSGQHNGFVSDLGLLHQRSLSLVKGGLALVGADHIHMAEKGGKHRFDRHMAQSTQKGQSYMLRFHLHPDVKAHIERSSLVAILRLKSGEVWQFRHDGTLHLSLERSVYLEKSCNQPKDCKQIVLSGKLFDYEAHIKWSFSKSRADKPQNRDLEAPILDDIQDVSWQI